MAFHFLKECGFLCRHEIYEIFYYSSKPYHCNSLRNGIGSILYYHECLQFQRKTEMILRALLPPPAPCWKGMLWSFRQKVTLLWKSVQPKRKLNRPQKLLQQKAKPLSKQKPSHNKPQSKHRSPLLPIPLRLHRSRPPQRRLHRHNPLLPRLPLLQRICRSARIWRTTRFWTPWHTLATI